MARKKKVSIETPGDEVMLEPEVIDSEEVVDEATSKEEKAEGIDAAEILEDEADDEASAADEAPTEEELIKKARAEANEFKDRYLRLQAEWDNFRKRNQAEREAERTRANERLVGNLLPVIDDFERAIAHAQEAPDAQMLLAGIEAVHSKFIDTLKKEKVDVIDPVGEAFDAMKHQAIGKVDDNSVPDETVMDVYQKGYEMGGKVVRPAMVTVSSGGPYRQPEES